MLFSFFAGSLWVRGGSLKEGGMADEKGEVAQVPQEKFIEMIHAQNEQCAMAVEQRPRNDQALAVWGAGLLQLAMMEDEVPKKKELLRDCREKLNKAIKVNPDAASPDGQLAIFQLVNAFCNAPAPSQISSKLQWACSVHAASSVSWLTFLLAVQT